MNPDCSSNCCSNGSFGEVHNSVLLDRVVPACLTLGYDRYLCVNCGKIEKRYYVAPIGHAWQSVVIREATCETAGKGLNICSNPGCTVKECTICGDQHIADITPALPHGYVSVMTPATCESGGHTTHIC